MRLRRFIGISIKLVLLLTLHSCTLLHDRILFQYCFNSLLVSLYHTQCTRHAWEALMLFLPCVAQPCFVVFEHTFHAPTEVPIFPHQTRTPIISGHTRHLCVMNNQRWSMPKAECRCDVTCALIIEFQLMQIPSLFNPLSILVYDTYSHHGCSIIII